MLLTQKYCALTIIHTIFFGDHYEGEKQRRKFLGEGGGGFQEPLITDIPGGWEGGGGWGFKVKNLPW